LERQALPVEDDGLARLASGTQRSAEPHRETGVGQRTGDQAQFECARLLALANRDDRTQASAGWLDFSVLHSERTPSIEALPPISIPNSVLVATESEALVPVARCPATTR
jgi:hypothetical protein